MKNPKLNELKKNHPAVFNYIKQKANEKDEEGNFVYFVGLRNERICIYYRTRILLEFCVKNDDVIITSQPVYLKGTGLSNPLDCKNLNESLVNTIKEIIDRFVKDNSKQEFVCQQYIATMYNSHSFSDWFVIDMECEQEGNRSFGRQDLIAIRRTPIYGRHEVAIIKLKVGKDSFDTLTADMVKEYSEQFAEIKKSLYSSLDESSSTEATSAENLKFGSGIVSHMICFMRYLYNEDNYAGLKEELFQMLQQYRLLGINPLDIKSASDFSRKPTIYIVSYTHAPGWDSKAKKEDLLAKTSTRSAQQRLKFFFGRCLYEKGYCLENMLNENEISSFISESAKEDWNKVFIDSNDVFRAYDQDIGGRDYRFVFSFIDPDTLGYPWECLEKHS